MRTISVAMVVIGLLAASEAWAVPVGPGGRIYLTRYGNDVTQLLRIDVDGSWTVASNWGVIASLTNDCTTYGGEKVKYVTSPEILQARADEDGLATGGDGSVFLAGYYDNDLHVRYSKVAADGSSVTTMHPGCGEAYAWDHTPGADTVPGPWTGGTNPTAFVVDRKGEATQGPGSVAFFGGAGGTYEMASGSFTDEDANDRYDDAGDTVWQLGYNRCTEVGGYQDVEIGGPGCNYNGTDNTIYFTSGGCIDYMTRRASGSYGSNAHKKYYHWYDAYTTGNRIINPTSGMAAGDTDNDTNTDVYILSSAAGTYRPFPRNGVAIFRLADLDDDGYVDPDEAVDLVQVFYDDNTLTGDLNDLEGEADLELIREPTTGRWTLLVLQGTGRIIAMDLADNGDFASTGSGYDPDGFHVVLDNGLTEAGYSPWGMEFDADPSEAPPIPGDANGDGKIDGGDLAIWQQNYDPLGTGNNTFALGDFNGDGKIDGGDLAIWQQNYDPLGSGGLDGLGANVPEPATLLLLGTGALGAIGALRRRRVS